MYLVMLAMLLIMESVLLARMELFRVEELVPVLPVQCHVHLAVVPMAHVFPVQLDQVFRMEHAQFVLMGSSQLVQILVLDVKEIVQLVIARQGIV